VGNRKRVVHAVAEFEMGFPVLRESESHFIMMISGSALAHPHLIDISCAFFAFKTGNSADILEP
jgi:hypothetical protein